MLLLADVSVILPGEAGRLAKCAFIEERLVTLANFNKDGHLSQCIHYLRQ